MVQNEDQLAVVMGHELAHAILLHGVSVDSVDKLAVFLDIMIRP